MLAFGLQQIVQEVPLYETIHLWRMPCHDFRAPSGFHARILVTPFSLGG